MYKRTAVGIRYYATASVLLLCYGTTALNMACGNIKYNNNTHIC